MRFSVSNINITVIDINDNPPVFNNTPYSTRLPEGFVEATQLILTVQAVDADSGSNGEVVYSIAGGVSGEFQIDSNTVSTN